MSQLCSDAYTTVLKHEAVLASYETKVALASVRVLGYILLEDLAEEGIEQLARAIQTPEVDLIQLGLFYTKYFVKICA